jgi:hypothetical protein
MNAIERKRSHKQWLKQMEHNKQVIQDTMHIEHALLHMPLSDELQARWNQVMNTYHRGLITPDEYLSVICVDVYGPASKEANQAEELFKLILIV